MTKREWLERRYRTEPEREIRFSTVSDMEVEPVYTADDAEKDGDRVGLPGEFPYTRGVYPSMYRGRLWTMRQFAGFARRRRSTICLATSSQSSGTSTWTRLPNAVDG